MTAPCVPQNPRPEALLRPLQRKKRDRRAEADRPAKSHTGTFPRTPCDVDADMRATMYRLQEEYDARLKACLGDTLLMTETERMVLHIVIDMGSVRQGAQRSNRLLDRTEGY